MVTIIFSCFAKIAIKVAGVQAEVRPYVNDL